MIVHEYRLDSNEDLADDKTIKIEVKQIMISNAGSQDMRSVENN